MQDYFQAAKLVLDAVDKNPTVPGQLAAGNEYLVNQVRYETSTWLPRRRRRSVGMWLSQVSS